MSITQWTLRMPTPEEALPGRPQRMPVDAQHFVLGTPMDSTFAYGMAPIEMRERFEEARQLILRAWSEPEPFAFNGKYTQLRYVNIWPRPIQKRMPIWVPGGGGSVETWDLVIDNDYCYGHLSFSGLYSSKPLVDLFWEYVDKRGCTMNPIAWRSHRWSV